MPAAGQLQRDQRGPAVVRAQRHEPVPHPVDHLGEPGEAGPQLHVADRRRAERREVAPHQRLHGVRDVAPVRQRGLRGSSAAPPQPALGKFTLGNRLLLTLALAVVVAVGCQSSNTKVTSLQSQNRVLSEQSRAQLAEIENLKIHKRRVEDELISAERQLAELDRSGRHLAGSNLPAGVSGRLAALAERYPSLQFDPQTGISKLDTDVLFDSGNDELKPGAEQLLGEIAQIFGSPESRELKLMVVGHADSQGIKGVELRSRYPTNWHLSAGRALAVADWLRGSGIPENRMGVAGFGQFQPIASNDSEDTRSRNRRVEIYVLGPETPVVGWADTSGRFYR